MSVEDHIQFLREKVMFTSTRWPFYELLISDLLELSDAFQGRHVLSMERNELYGGDSVFTPFFEKSHVYVKEMSPPKNKARGAYNDVDDERRLRVKPGTLEGKADLIIMPNVLHHHPSLAELMSTINALLHKDGYLYIFEPLHRELHQVPEDYWRFTPYGLGGILAGNGFELEKENEIGDVTDVIAYFIDQLYQYAPEAKDQLHPLMDQLLTVRVAGGNKVRENTRCPMAFSILARKT